MFEARIRTAPLSAEERELWFCGRLLIWCGHESCRGELCRLARVSPIFAQWQGHLASNAINLLAGLDHAKVPSSSIPWWAKDSEAAAAAAKMVAWARRGVDEEGNVASDRDGESGRHFVWVAVLAADLVASHPDHWQRSARAAKKSRHTSRSRRFRFDPDSGDVGIWHLGRRLDVKGLHMPTGRDGVERMLSIPQCEGPFILHDRLTFTCPRCKRESDVVMTRADEKMRELDAKQKGGQARRAPARAEPPATQSCPV